MRTARGSGWVIGTALLTTTIAPSVALAQQPAAAPASKEASADETTGDFTSLIELTRAAIQVRRQALVTAAMDFEPKEADVFWPLYREYRVEIATVNDRFVRLLTGYLERYDSLTDETAAKMLDEYLSIERARNSVKEKYMRRFSQSLPARKVARFFQVDNKLDALILAELATAVPLAR
jgi:hypothetical protein